MHFVTAYDNIGIPDAEGYFIVFDRLCKPESKFGSRYPQSLGVLASAVDQSGALIVFHELTTIQPRKGNRR
jgi:hypothetical protein